MLIFYLLNLIRIYQKGKYTSTTQTSYGSGPILVFSFFLKKKKAIRFYQNPTGPNLIKLETQDKLRGEKQKLQSKLDGQKRPSQLNILLNVTIGTLFFPLPLNLNQTTTRKEN